MLCRVTDRLLEQGELVMKCRQYMNNGRREMRDLYTHCFEERIYYRPYKQGVTGVEARDGKHVPE